MTISYFAIQVEDNVYLRGKFKNTIKLNEDIPEEAKRFDGVQQAKAYWNRHNLLKQLYPYAEVVKIEFQHAHFYKKVVESL